MLMLKELTSVKTLVKTLIIVLILNAIISIFKAAAPQPPVFIINLSSSANNAPCDGAEPGESEEFESPDGEPSRANFKGHKFL
jgi:hypothetical protein